MFGKVGRIALEEVVLHLVHSKCLPILLYGFGSLSTRKLCYLKDDRAMRAIYVDRVSRCGDMAIRNYPRWRPAANLDLM